MSKTPAEKRQILIQRTATALGIAEADAAALLRTPRRQSLRINPLKGDPAATIAELGSLAAATLEAYDWMHHGYTYTSEAFPHAIRDSRLIAEGNVFIQNAASWLPVIALDPHPGDTLLDICAAPGGKTSHIAALTRNAAHITANDNSRPRLAKLRANLQRLGVTDVETTLYDATQIGRKLEGRVFDRILLDAPCSGEGMMHLDNDKDFASWSVAHIKRLQQLQKRIIGQAWQLLAPGGTLVYSTCTMAPEENEAVVDYLLRSHDDAEIMPFTIELPNRVTPVKEWNGKQFNTALSHCVRLVPSPTIEAFFVCIIRKRVVA